MDKKEMVYKILRLIEKSAKSSEKLRVETVADKLKINKDELQKTLSEMVAEGYIKGIKVKELPNSNAPVVFRMDSAEITLKGEDYIKNNSTGSKTIEALKTIKEVTPGF